MSLNLGASSLKPQAPSLIRLSPALEAHPVLSVLLESAASVSGAALAADLRLMLRRADPGTAMVRASGLAVPVVPPFGAEEGLAILADAAHRLDRDLFEGKARARYVEWAPRIFRVAGRALLARGGVELSWRLYCEVGLLAMAPVLAHELVHLWLHARKRASGHTAEFERKSCELALPELSHRLAIRSGGHRYWCPGCKSQCVRAARLGRPMACASCCNHEAGGRFDSRFVLVWIGRDEPRHRFYGLDGSYR